MSNENEESESEQSNQYETESKNSASIEDSIGKETESKEKNSK